MSVHSAGPMARSGGCRYSYDAAGIMVHTESSQGARWRFWRSGRVIHEMRREDGSVSHVTWLHALGRPTAELVSGSGARKSLLATSLSGSVMLEAGSGLHSHAYSPGGYRGAGKGEGSELAFNGEILDAGSGCYLLGAGNHRPYSPTLGSFLAMDRAGPFGRGGLNTLSYCAGDPVNRADPTGRFWNWVIGAVALALSVVAVAFTAGTALGVLAGTVALTKATGAAVIGTGLGAAAIAAESGSLIAQGVGDDKAASILGWVGVGFGAVGLAGAVPSIVKGIGKGLASLAAKASKFAQRTGSMRSVTVRSVSGSVRSSASSSSTSSISSRSLRGSISPGTTQRMATQRSLSRQSSIHSSSSRISGGSAQVNQSVIPDDAMTRLLEAIAGGQIRGRDVDRITDVGEDFIDLTRSQLDRSKPAAWTSREWALEAGDMDVLANADEQMEISAWNFPDAAPALPRNVETLPPGYSEYFDDLPPYHWTLPPATG